MPSKNDEPRKPARDESRKATRDDSSRASSSGFEQRLERLESLAEKLREGNIPLEEAVAIFEEGMKLSKSLEKDLARVERRVEILTGEAGTEEEKPGLELFPELSDEETE